MKVFLLAMMVPIGVALWSCSGGRSSSTRSAALTSSAKKPQIIDAIIPKGQAGRWRTRSMRPRFITIHSTQNYHRSGDARTHARMLQRGSLKSRNNSLGFLTWHFSVDDSSIYQSLPTNEQGQHADYEGLGNRASIGIEMCENAGNSFPATLDRTARLTAWLMKKHRIPLKNVVPHQHWRRIRHSDGRDLGHKNCPKPLLTNGKLGPKWFAFKKRIESYM